MSKPGNAKAALNGRATDDACAADSTARSQSKMNGRLPGRLLA